MKSINFNQQVYEIKPSLQVFAYKFTQNYEDADDLVQDTLLKAMRYTDQFSEGTNLKAWMYTIMKNIFINNYRRLVIKRSLITTEEEINSSQLLNSSYSNQADNKFMQDDIHRALEKLDKNYYVPFIKYFEGYKYHEIADMLQIPIGTVKTNIHMARQLLKKNLKMYNEEFKKSNKYN